MDPTQDNHRAGKRRFRLGRRLWLLPVIGVIGLAAAAPLPHAGAGEAAAPEDGLAPMCKNGGPNGASNYVVTARDGYISTPDGNSIYMWGYSTGNDPYQHPGPALCVHEGDTVTITLRNTLPVATSMMFVGIDGVTFNGSPATPSAADLQHGDLTPSVAPAPPNGPVQSGTYQFVASHAGTYLYESGTSPEVQDQMGLFGALIVRPKPLTPAACQAEPKGAGCYDDYVYDPAETGWDPTVTLQNPNGSALTAGKGMSSQFNPDREFLHILSEIDPDLHACFESAATPGRAPAVATDNQFNARCDSTKNPFTYDMSQYRARYWQINGRSMPDTIAPNNSDHLPSQPFSALVHVRPRLKGTATGVDNLPAVVRYLNAGPVAYPFHPHAQHEQMIGVDGRPRVARSDGLGLADPATGNPATVPGGVTISDQSQDRFDVVVPPGQTIDTFFSWVDAVGWDANSRPIDFGGVAQNGHANNPLPWFNGSQYANAPGVIVPQKQNKLNGEYWSGSPYLGTRVSANPGEVQFDECGEYYDVAHSHALFQVTNFSADMGGMLTMIRVDPPGGCEGR